MPYGDTAGIVFNIQRFSLHDGPGIRTIVFLKGCPLSCHWCCNPESINSSPELVLIKLRCNQCGKCVEVCPERALSIQTEVITFDRRRCTLCGKCLEVCRPKALMIYGEEKTAAAVFEEVLKDKIYYDGSGGGLTISGGEALAQPQFARALLKLSRGKGINTCLETSGYGAAGELEEVLEFTDCVLFDLKHMDPGIHRRYIGKGNEIIQENARLLARSSVSVVWRMPLIPGVNDTLDNIKQTADFVRSLGKKAEIEILPYHRLGAGKYQALGRRYLMDGIEVHTPQQKAMVKQTFEECGVQCHIVE